MAGATNRRNSYQKNRAFADGIETEIATILVHVGMLLTIRRATFAEDTKEGCDLVFELHDNSFAATRVRRHEYYKRYGDFTIRAKVGNAKTELHKLLNGEFKSRLYFYGWRRQSNDGWSDWLIADVRQLRKCIPDEPRIVSNKDGTGHVAIPLETLYLADAIIENYQSFARLRDDHNGRLPRQARCKCGSSFDAIFRTTNGGIRRDCFGCGAFQDFESWPKSGMACDGKGNGILF